MVEIRLAIHSLLCKFFQNDVREFMVDNLYNVVRRKIHSHAMMYGDMVYELICGTYLHFNLNTVSTTSSHFDRLQLVTYQ